MPILSPELQTFLLAGTRTAKLATVRADGQPHVVPIWFLLDGETIVFTTGSTSVKARNIKRDHRVSLCVDDEQPPFLFNTALLTEVKDQLQELEVPVKGVISDGEETLGSAIAFVFPKAPHQLCQFHYLKDAIDPRDVADRHAKTQLKKQLRGVRPMERALEQQKTPENQAIRGYCLAVRAALTDDSRSPLQPSGLKLFDRVTQVRDSLARIQEKKAYHQL